MAYDNENKPDEKKEVFETPKMLNLEGEEITEEELEDASGGLADLADSTCTGGGCCGGS